MKRFPGDKPGKGGRSSKSSDKKTGYPHHAKPNREGEGKPFKRFSDDKRREYRKPDADSTRTEHTGDERPARRSYNKDSSLERKPYQRREGEGERSERRPYQRREGEGERSERKPYQRKEGEGERSERKPYQRREGEGERSERKPYQRTERKPYQRREGEGERSERKPYQRREGEGERSERRPYQRREGEGERSERKPYQRREGEGERSERKPYQRREGEEERSERRPYQRREGEGERSERKPYQRREGDGERSERKPYQRREGDGERSERKPRFDDKNGGFGKPFAKKPAKTVSRDDGTIRLNKYISNAGVCSRREADTMIEAGAVSINGVVVTELGTRVNPGDKVQIGNETLNAEKKVYILLNKPKGYITTVDDPQERNTVMMLIKGACRERVNPVGRLDRNTSGLLLFTNDGEMAAKLTHPSHQVRKMYQVEVNRTFSKSDMIQMTEGVKLEDGLMTVDEIAYTGTGEDKKTLGVVIHSGKNRVVRRMFEALDYEVVKLDRVVFANLTKKDLPRGRWRFLTESELNMLKMI